MILLLSVILGWLAGWGLTRWQGRSWIPPDIKFSVFLAIGFLPQWLAFYFEPTRRWMPDQVASFCLVVSQAILLICVFLNIRLAGMPFLFLGLGSNLLVIAANGGFMPLVAESARRLISEDILLSVGYGERIGYASKDILLMESAIRFPWLADRFIAPPIFDQRVIFSIGDVSIALGAFLLLATGKKIQSLKKPEM